MRKVGCISLGCPKNLVDTEVMLGCLCRDGYVATPQINMADVLIVNTCGFIESAKEESIQAILEAASMKRSGSCKTLVVAGCLVERYQKQLLEELPEIDVFVGIREIEKITDLLEAHGKTTKPISDPKYIYNESSPRLLTTHPGTAYIKISDGCSHACSFCAIPKIRGFHRSRTIQSILEEARRMVERGIVEINLVGQDTTVFGSDLGEANALETLVKELGKVDGLRWFRIHYAHPHRLADGLLDAIAETQNCCKYVDVPLQHVNQAILKSMGRGGNKKLFTELVERIRKKIQGVFIRSNFIVGFPGEDVVAFEELQDFITEAQFDHLGVFTYSIEEGTPAYPLGDPIQNRTKEKRMRILMEMQQAISKRRNQELVGKTIEVIVEAPHEETDLIIKGRHSGQAPEIDGNVLIVGGEPKLYTIQNVKITEAHPYDLVGMIE
ncbi:MAG: 30S ribosomal protein S12 methylthiotransferase RimO [Holophagaceae bacterium]|nr:30S ribosomal protein S12 methylthiotransferase RimO [Holophagaceae bacterium]